MPSRNPVLDRASGYQHRGRRPAVGRPRARAIKNAEEGTDSEFVDWLRAQLTNRDWPDCELAERIGVSPATVSRWMGGSRVPSPGNVTRMAHALSVDDGEILTKLTEGNAPMGTVSRSPEPNPAGIAPRVNLDAPQFAEWLRLELLRQHISADDLARHVGVEATVVRFWLLGLLTPAPHQLGNLAAALNRGRGRRLAV